MVVVQDFEKRQSEVRRAFDLKVAKSHPLDWPSKPRWLKPGDLERRFAKSPVGTLRVAGWMPGV